MLNEADEQGQEQINYMTITGNNYRGKQGDSRPFGQSYQDQTESIIERTSGRRMAQISFTVFPHIIPAGIIFSLGLQLRVLLEITKFHLHNSVPGAGFVRNAGII